MKKCQNCGFIPPKKERNRSNAENAYFHGCVLPILATHTGYSADEMKAVLKWKFKIINTSSLSTIEFEKFMSDVRQWASAELSVYIPLPKETEIYA